MLSLKSAWTITRHCLKKKKKNRYCITIYLLHLACPHTPALFWGPTPSSKAWGSQQMGEEGGPWPQQQLLEPFLD